MSELVINSKEIGLLGFRRTRGIQGLCTEDIDGVHDHGEATFGGRGYLTLSSANTFKLNPMVLELKFKTAQKNATLLFLSESTEVLFSNDSKFKIWQIFLIQCIKKIGLDKVRISHNICISSYL